MRDANLRKRGIDPDDNESQLKEIEDRGKQILLEYKKEKEKEGNQRKTPGENRDENFAPVQNSLMQLGMALGNK